MVTQTAIRPIITREELECYLPNPLRHSGSEYRTWLEPSRSRAHVAINLDKQAYYDKFRLDPANPESIEHYFSKAIQAQAYVATMRENTMRATRKRAEKDHRMPTGGNKWAYDYHHYRSYQKPDQDSGRYTLDPQRAVSRCQLKDWVLSGLSLSKCEQQFEQLTGIKLNRATLYRMLTDPIVIGKVYAYRHKMIVDLLDYNTTIYTLRQFILNLV